LSVFLLGMTVLTFQDGLNPAERNNAGIGLYRDGDFEGALVAFQVAQVNAPDESIPYLNAGLALARRGDWDEAIAALEQALKTADPTLAAEVYFSLGNIHFQMRDFEQAVFAYQRSLLLNPSDMDARYNLELALLRLIPPTATEMPEMSGESLSATVESQQSISVGVPQGALSREEAEQLLDAAQGSQQVLGQGVPTPGASESQDAPDW
jgi:tetratricopeptide (TPR) repeat protein